MSVAQHAVTSLILPVPFVLIGLVMLCCCRTEPGKQVAKRLLLFGGIGLAIGVTLYLVTHAAK